MTREISLQNGLATLVSDIDHERCLKHTWRANPDNYVCTTIRLEDGRRTTLYLHRMITGCPPTHKADHRDNDTLNNQRPNLRITTFDQNNANRQYWSTTGYKGVSRVRHRFRARITIAHEDTHLGYFADAAEAARAYDKVAHQLFGEFAWLNFPEEYPLPCHDTPDHEVPF